MNPLTPALIESICRAKVADYLLASNLAQGEEFRSPAKFSSCGLSRHLPTACHRYLVRAASSFQIPEAKRHMWKDIDALATRSACGHWFALGATGGNA